MHDALRESSGSLVGGERGGVLGRSFFDPVEDFNRLVVIFPGWIDINIDIKTIVGTERYNSWN
jgi:hypothetical protein